MAKAIHAYAIAPSVEEKWAAAHNIVELENFTGVSIGDFVSDRAGQRLLRTRAEEYRKLQGSADCVGM